MTWFPTSAAISRRLLCVLYQDGTTKQYIHYHCYFLFEMETLFQPPDDGLGAVVTLLQLPPLFDDGFLGLDTDGFLLVGGLPRL